VLDTSQGYVRGLLRLPCFAGTLRATLPPAFTPCMALIVRPAGIFQAAGDRQKSRRRADKLAWQRERSTGEGPRVYELLVSAAKDRRR
jgi:hypothetical protein